MSNRVKITNPDTREKLQQVIRVLNDVIEQKKPYDICGTVYDTIGYCAQDKWFNKRGLYLKRDILGLYPVYLGWPCFMAIKLFFGFEEHDGTYLFSSSGYRTNSNNITPNVVKRRIKYVLKRGIPSSVFGEQ